MSDRRISAKQKFIETASTLFANRGYHGVSLADVAEELGLTKQAVLYHFQSKQALYAAVLQGMADRLEAVVARARSAECDEDTRLELFLRELHDHMQADPVDGRIIARELLDNLDRAATSRKWVLRGFLEDCVELLRGARAWKGASDDELTAVVYQMIGAINYFAISDVTLTGIWGKKRLAGMKSAFFPALLKTFIQRT